MLKGIVSVILLFIGGCGLKVKVNVEKKVLSCEEKASKNSLQYLEQQYRCTAE